jgi:hypothetical protein
MDVTAVIDRVRDVSAVRAAPDADRAVLEGGLRSIGMIRSWLTAAEADLAARLAACASFPELAIAEAGRGSQGEASRVLERSSTLGAVPALAGALDDGSVTAGHVDAVTKVAKGLDGTARGKLLERADRLVGLARHGTVSDFRKRLEREANSLREDDGTARFERQQRAARVRRWTDADGMWCVSGRFDPLTGVRLDARLQAEIEAAFAESVPAGCPTDPLAKSEFLAACALARIMDGDGVVQRAGRPEFVVVIEADEPASADSGHADEPTESEPDGRRPRADWGLPVELPWSVLVEHFGNGDVYPVIVRNGVVLYAPGELNLGRSTRLASRAQRRALRALYRGCGVPGCETRFDRCKIHHILWWRHGGRTDLENLLPLCVHHHTRVHRDGWVITMGPGRVLTLRLPDGTVHITGPPRRNAA